MYFTYMYMYMHKKCCLGRLGYTLARTLSTMKRMSHIYNVVYMYMYMYLTSMTSVRCILSTCSFPYNFKQDTVVNIFTKQIGIRMG